MIFNFSSATERLQRLLADAGSEAILLEVQRVYRVSARACQVELLPISPVPATSDGDGVGHRRHTFHLAPCPIDLMVGQAVKVERAGECIHARRIAPR